MSSERLVYIYGLIDPRDHTLRYVGRTICCVTRLSNHKARFDGPSPRDKWIKELRGFGLAPHMIVLSEVAVDEQRQAERRAIAQYRRAGCNLLNVKAGGGSTKTGDEPTVMVGGFVPPSVRKAIKRIADKEEITMSYALRKLLEESPRVRKELKAA